MNHKLGEKIWYGFTDHRYFQAAKSIVRVSILEKCYRGYGSAMITLNNNMVFLNLIISAMGQLVMLLYFNYIINLARAASLTTVFYWGVVINGYA